MASDIENFRQRIDELEATVRGLTQELVEANERLRVLEEHVDDEDLAAAANKPMPSGTDGETTSGESTDVSEDAGETAEGTAEEEADDDEGASDDIIVA